MTPIDSSEIAELLDRHRSGDGEAFDGLVRALYPTLREMAHAQLSRAPRRATLSTTALVNEAYVRMVGSETKPWNDRCHFQAVAATVMKRIIIDYARQRTAKKRGGRMHAVTLQPWHLKLDEQAEHLLILDRALETLASFNQRLANVVEMRFFGGMTGDETAAALGISPATVKRDWLKAKAWLLRELDEPVADLKPSDVAAS